MSGQCTTASESNLRAMITEVLEAEDVERLENILKHHATQNDSALFTMTWQPHNYDLWRLFDTAFLKCHNELTLPSVLGEQQHGNLLAYAILQVENADKMVQCVRLIVEHTPHSVLNGSLVGVEESDAHTVAGAAGVGDECVAAAALTGKNSGNQLELSPLVALILRAQRDTFQQGVEMRKTFDFLLESGADIDIMHHSPLNHYKSSDVAILSAISRNPAMLYAVLSTGRVNIVQLAEDVLLFATTEVTLFMPGNLYDKYIQQAMVGSAMLVLCCASAMDRRVMSALERITVDGINFRDYPGTLDMIKRFLPAQVMLLKEKCRAVIRQRLTETGCVSAETVATLPIPVSQQSYIAEVSDDFGQALASELRLRLTKATHKRRPGALQENDCFFGEDTAIDNIADDASDYETSDDELPDEYDDTYDLFHAGDADEYYISSDNDHDDGVHYDDDYDDDEDGN